MSVNPTQIETTLIGTGGGYGESIVVNIGNNEWIIVDSCINPITYTPLPLEYLKSLDVNIKTDVKLIICTHWHDDHIRGISKVLEECESAKFSLSKTTDRTKFLQFVGKDYSKIKSEATVASTKEIKTCFDIVENRGVQVVGAIQDRLLYSNKKLNGIDSLVISLSPSDYVINEFDREISTLITEFGGSEKKVIYNSPNDKSVVILIKINDQRILLGSDLEVSENPQKGWRCIIQESIVFNEKSHIFKIPHHGSITAYEKSIWDSLIDNNAIAKLSPWKNGDKKLPKKEMIDAFLSHTSELYITSIPSKAKGHAKKRDKSIEKAIRQKNSTLKEVKFYEGIVRCSLDLSSKSPAWNVELFGGAKKVDTNTFTLD